MAGQQPRRRYGPCGWMILFVCARTVSQANLGDYYRVLKRLQKCEGIDVLRQAGVHLLRSNIPPAEGGVLVLRDTRVLRRLQHSHTPIPPEGTGNCNLTSMVMRPCARHLTAEDSLTKGARLGIAGLNDRSVSAGRDDLVQLTTIPFDPTTYYCAVLQRTMTAIQIRNLTRRLSASASRWTPGSTPSMISGRKLLVQHGGALLSHLDAMPGRGKRAGRTLVLRRTIRRTRSISSQSHPLATLSDQ